MPGGQGSRGLGRAPAWAIMGRAASAQGSAQVVRGRLGTDAQDRPWGRVPSYPREGEISWGMYLGSPWHPPA